MPDATQEVLNGFYKEEFIIKRERFYGKHYLSPGGEEATRELFLRMGLQPGEKVLDIGCGQGGPAMCMARYYGAHVHGLELATNMVKLGKERLAVSESFVKQRVQLELADATTVQLRKDHYDVIYSKDSIVHIKEKTKLFEKCKDAVRPGGRLFITDWCLGDKQPSQNFIDYYNNDFNIETISSNVQHMEAAGFKGVKYEDLTQEMINNIEHSLKHFRSTKQAFIQDFDAESYNDIVDRFTQYVVWAKNGELLWVLFTASA
ncbi:unnamed protein product [Meganyctiphanes norvegica]|uniref:phosphoethanolamine N-methyltransferase n=1 Tax=Meganyctiphanes norvegica TaxID=48144 RepID=A0AAV2PQC9_MEGNR